jgi:hypothetical protein
MLHVGQPLLLCRAIAGQLIADQHAWNVLRPLQQFPKELLGRALVRSAVHQDIKHVERLIDSSPHIVQFAVDFEKDLIKMALVAGACRSPAQLVGRVLPKGSTALTEGLVGQHDCALSQQLFEITIAERESIVEPDRVADDLGRKSIARVRGRG